MLLADVTSLAQSNKNKDEPSPKKDEVNTLLKQEFELEDKGDFAAAIEISKKICKLQPNDPRPLNTIAGLYGKLGKFEEEITWAKEAIAVDSQYAPAYVNLGNALASSGKLAEAQIIFSKAAELAPKDPLAVYSLGVIAEQENKPYEALGFYNKSVELDPKFENG
ncbi:MAG TPA: tetratricopeptide repeat protein, partial [Candidatus Angelobacter sp.]|nr:tetratricopeptide repeat protein [Candidatus Angelobacter sp.]